MRSKVPGAALSSALEHSGCTRVHLNAPKSFWQLFPGETTTQVVVPTSDDDTIGVPSSHRMYLPADGICGAESSFSPLNRHLERRDMRLTAGHSSISTHLMNAFFLDTAICEACPVLASRARPGVG